MSAPGTAADVLVAARELIADESRWTKGAYARNAKRRRVKVLSKSAVCWCGVGAVSKVVGADPEYDTALDLAACGLLADALPEDHVTIFEFNDTHTHADVLALFDDAIAIALARGATG